MVYPHPCARTQLYRPYNSSQWQLIGTFGLSIIIRLVTLTDDLQNGAVGNLPTNFSVSRTFRFRCMGQHLSDASRDLATLTFDLMAQGHVIRLTTVGREVEKVTS